MKRILLLALVLFGCMTNSEKTDPVPGVYQRLSGAAINLRIKSDYSWEKYMAGADSANSSIDNGSITLSADTLMLIRKNPDGTVCSSKCLADGFIYSGDTLYSVISVGLDTVRLKGRFPSYVKMD